MCDPNEYAAYYLERLRQGDFDGAFFGLIEADVAVLPVLINAFAKDENRAIRAPIVECIWQFRRPEAIPLLAEVLHDPDPGVWQQALDGLVAIGGCEAIQALQAARTRLRACRIKRAITVEWIDEALEQLQDEADQ